MVAKVLAVKGFSSSARAFNVQRQNIAADVDEIHLGGRTTKATTRAVYCTYTTPKYNTE